jgi:hypothetical protein
MNDFLFMDSDHHYLVYMTLPTALRKIGANLRRIT